MYKIIPLLFCLLLPAYALADTLAGEVRCDTPSQTNCVKAGEELAWVSAKGVSNIDPHFLLQYFRGLRNSYGRDEITLKYLENRISQLLKPSVYRGDSLVWENKHGYAQAMEQGGYAAYFIGLGNLLETKKKHHRADYYYELGLSMFNAFGVEAGVRTGGVSLPPVKCGSKRTKFEDCRWFTSRGLSINYNGAGIVLNQHLHSINSLLSVAVALDIADRDNTKAMQKVMEGLYQLAFATNSVNATTFMSKKLKGVKSGNAIPYYTAYYEILGGKGTDIAYRNTCHYQTFSVQTLSTISRVVNRYDRYINNYPKLWKIHQAINHLVKGSNEPTGMEGSTSAFMQWFKSEGNAYKVRREDARKAL